MVDKSRFKNSNGTFYTQGLFYETCGVDKSSAVYTLKDRDHEGLPSLKLLYLQAKDITEYKFAQEHLGGLEHWEKLLSCGWFEDYLYIWRKELLLQLKSEALARIQNIAREGGKESFVANRFLLQEFDKQSKQPKRGRPSNSEIKKAAHEIATETKQLDDDYNRLKGLGLIQ